MQPTPRNGRREPPEVETMGIAGDRASDSLGSNRTLAILRVATEEGPVWHSTCGPDNARPERARCPISRLYTQQTLCPEVVALRIMACDLKPVAPGPSGPRALCLRGTPFGRQERLVPFGGPVLPERQQVIDLLAVDLHDLDVHRVLGP